MIGETPRRLAPSRLFGRHRYCCHIRVNRTIDERALPLLPQPGGEGLGWSSGPLLTEAGENSGTWLCLLINPSL